MFIFLVKVGKTKTPHISLTARAGGTLCGKEDNPARRSYPERFGTDLDTDFTALGVCQECLDAAELTSGLWAAKLENHRTIKPHLFKVRNIKRTMCGLPGYMPPGAKTSLALKIEDFYNPKIKKNLCGICYHNARKELEN